MPSWEKFVAIDGVYNTFPQGYRKHFTRAGGGVVMVPKPHPVQPARIQAILHFGSNAVVLDSINLHDDRRLFQNKHSVSPTAERHKGVSSNPTWDD